MAEQFDLVIVGAGPAGLTAAIYGARARLRTIVLDEGMPGGQVKTTHKVSTYPERSTAFFGLAGVLWSRT